MRRACKLCVLRDGIRGSNIDRLLKTEEELLDHLESEHHTPCRREWETSDECWTRFIQAYPEAKDPRTCKCPRCIAKRFLAN